MINQLDKYLRIISNQGHHHLRMKNNKNRKKFTHHINAAEQSKRPSIFSNRKPAHYTHPAKRHWKPKKQNLKQTEKRTFHTA